MTSEYWYNTKGFDPAKGSAKVASSISYLNDLEILDELKVSAIAYDPVDPIVSVVGVNDQVSPSKKYFTA